MTFEAGMGSGAMGSGGMSSGGSRTITAFFDSRTDAENAIQRLAAAGISRENVRMVEGGQGSGGGASVTQSSYGESGSGFWDALKDLFIPDEDRYTYAEGLRRGGYLVTVQATDAQYEQAIDILDDDGTVDIDERASSWRSEGWSDYSSASAGGTAGSSFGESSGSTFGAGSTLGGSDRRSGYSDRTTGDRLDASGDQEVIPVAEEELRVSKRDVSHGRVRVRSYVVETPVEQDVSLREERVNVERRPVDRALTGGDEGLFQERTIDLEERAEEAVVAKEARVREELVINKEVDTRTETVSDTVRRTEVDIDDERDTLGTRTDMNRRSDTSR